MTIVSSFLATLGVQPDKASFAQANSLLGGLESNAGKIAGVLGAAFAGHELLNWGKSLVAQGDALNDMVAKTGLGAQTLQALGFAAEQNGSSLEAVSGALTRLGITSQQAAEGSKSAQENFRAFGISARELKAGLPTEEMLARIADKIADTTDPAQRASLAFKAFGKQGAALLPFLKNGRDGIAELQAEFKKLGGGLSDEFIQQADEVNDELVKLKVTTTSLGSTLGVMLLPAIIDIVKKMTDWAVAIRQLLEGTQFLQSALFVGTAAFIAWGVASLWASKSLRQNLGLIGTLALLAAGLDEVSTALRGGKTLIGTWIDKWAGLGTVDSLVRSIGQGLQVIKENLGSPFKILTNTFSDFRETMAGFDKRQARIEELKKAIAAEPDEDKKQVLVRQLIAQLHQSIDISEAIQGQTPRTTTRGMEAAAEVVLPGRATASAVNEGAASTLFGMEGKAVQSASGKVQIVSPKVIQLGEINITANTNASPREIGRHVRRAVRDAMDQQTDDVQRSRGRRDEAPDSGELDGDVSLEGLDEGTP